MRGDLGLDDGRGQSIFSVDQSKVDSGELARVARENLTPGQSITLDDGTRITFDSVDDWVALQVSHDPGQEAVLVFALLMLAGLFLSLSIKRRRFWVRVTPAADGRTRVELGGLARTDRAGYGEEFDRLRADLLDNTSGGER
jgi:cytochrome c biogenesis protein